MIRKCAKIMPKSRTNAIDGSLVRGSGLAMRCLAGLIALSAAVPSVFACRASAWPDPCPKSERLTARQCSAHLATEVCTWSVSKHEKNKKLLAEINSQRNVDFEEVNRCGCSFQWFTECFLGTEMNSDGYYVIATGAPGCEQSKAFENVSLNIDKGECGSIGQVLMRQGDVGP
jgi:hypothetical protein